MSQNPNKQVKLHIEKAIDHMDFIFSKLKKLREQADEGKCVQNDVDKVAHIDDALRDEVLYLKVFTLP